MDTAVHRFTLLPLIAEARERAWKRRLLLLTLLVGLAGGGTGAAIALSASHAAREPQVVYRCPAGSWCPVVIPTPAFQPPTIGRDFH